jgi:hypothetical protein
MDEFLVPNASFKRLYEEYKKYPQIIILVDHDNTVFDFHNVGSTHDRVIEVVQKAKSVLNAEIIIWTGNINIEAVEQYWKDNNIPYDSINEQSPKAIKFYEKLGHEPPRKLFSNSMLCDRCGLIQAYQDLELLIWLVEQEILKK